MFRGARKGTRIEDSRLTIAAIRLGCVLDCLFCSPKGGVCDSLRWLGGEGRRRPVGICTQRLCLFWAAGVVQECKVMEKWLIWLGKDKVDGVRVCTQSQFYTRHSGGR